MCVLPKEHILILLSKEALLALRWRVWFYWGRRRSDRWRSWIRKSGRRRWDDSRQFLCRPRK